MKVAVIGAGISGLATAMHLERAGVDVTIYEARERVGGNLKERHVGTPWGQSSRLTGLNGVRARHQAADRV